MTADDVIARLRESKPNGSSVFAILSETERDLLLARIDALTFLADCAQDIHDLRVLEEAFPHSKVQAALGAALAALETTK